MTDDGVLREHPVKYSKKVHGNWCPARKPKLEPGAEVEILSGSLQGKTGTLVEQSQMLADCWIVRLNELNAPVVYISEKSLKVIG